MSQNILTNTATPPLPGATAIATLNQAADSLARWWSGTAAPSLSATGLSGDLKGFVWHDTATNTLKVRNQADSAWIVLGAFDETNGRFVPTGGMQSSGQQVLTVSQTLALAQAGANLLINGAGVTLNLPTAPVTYLLSNIGASVVSLTYPNASDFGAVLNPGEQVMLAGDTTGYWRVVARGGAPIVAGAFTGLRLSAPGATQTAAIAAQSLALCDAHGAGRVFTGLSLTLNLAVGGPGGLDAGSVAANTWYAVWVINDAGQAQALASLSASAPTLPAGVTQCARIGWVRTDGAAEIKAFQQSGRRGQWINTGAGLPQMASGAAGSLSGTYVGFSVAAFVPSTASIIRLSLWVPGGVSGVAPNANYGASSSTANPPPLLTYNAGDAAISGDLTLESTNLYWFSQSAGAVYCLGWEDNL